MKKKTKQQIGEGSKLKENNQKNCELIRNNKRYHELTPESQIQILSIFEKLFHEYLSDFNIKKVQNLSLKKKTL